MRFDANVSIRPKGNTELGTRTETKNLNSFRFLENAINIEIEKQIDTLEHGSRVKQETLLYDPVNNETRPMRSKETAMDYRYFPEPDLLPVEIDEAYVEKIRSNLPELPREKVARFQREFSLSAADAEVVCNTRELAEYYETVVAICGDPAMAANWVRVELLAQLNRQGLSIVDSAIHASQLGELICRITDGTISGKMAKNVFELMWSGEGRVDEVIAARGLAQVSGSDALQPIIDEIIEANPDQVAQFRAGKEKVLGFLVGQVMKSTGGQANPKQVNDLIRAKLATD
jgi:aspartyl-tRNA(Asn)/glutamyl-tRNA(Gln) amidotransferase subunit B